VLNTTEQAEKRRRHMEQLSLRGPLHSAAQAQGVPPPQSSTAAYLIPTNATTMVLDTNNVGIIDPTTGYPHPQHPSHHPHPHPHAHSHPHPQQQQMGMPQHLSATTMNNHNGIMPPTTGTTVVDNSNATGAMVMLEEGTEWPKIGAQIRNVLEQAQQQALQRRRQLFPSTVPPPPSESPKLSKSSGNVLTSSSGGLNNGIGGSGGNNNNNAIDLDVPHSPTRLREEGSCFFRFQFHQDPRSLLFFFSCFVSLLANKQTLVVHLM